MNTASLDLDGSFHWYPIYKNGHGGGLGAPEQNQNIHRKSADMGPPINHGGHHRKSQDLGPPQNPGNMHRKSQDLGPPSGRE